jgi:voltage-gated potassium channel
VKVRYTCPDCGLNRHDPDAVHCKHCGRTINIATEGEG